MLQQLKMICSVTRAKKLNANFTFMRHCSLEMTLHVAFHLAQVSGFEQGGLAVRAVIQVAARRASLQLWQRASLLDCYMHLEMKR